MLLNKSRVGGYLGFSITPSPQTHTHTHNHSFDISPNKNSFIALAAMVNVRSAPKTLYHRNIIPL